MSSFGTRSKIFLKMTHQIALREARPNTAPFFSEVGLRKFVLASELFVPRPCMSFDSQKTREDLVACSSIYSSKKVVINEIKVENLVLNMFIANFSERASR